MTRNANEVAPRCRNPPLRRDPGHGVENRLEIDLGQRSNPLHLLEITVESKNRRLAQLQVDVTRAAFDGASQQGHEIHHVGCTIGSSGLHLYPPSDHVPGHPARPVDDSGAAGHAGYQP
jgi:hypothetical protein